MALNQLNKQYFYEAIVAGCHALINQKIQLNQINVFPVADGDTGDNMASTAMAILQFSSEQPTLKATVQSVADASIIGARGNSGIIFSQFFNALAENTLSEVSMTLKDFSKLLKKAAEKVRLSIAVPVEGTLLTLIESWATLINQTILQTLFFDEAMVSLLPGLDNQVKLTSTMLPALREAKVVDAGALGFYHFVYGFSHFLKEPTKQIFFTVPTKEKEVDHSFPIASEPPEHRYCTEAVVKADGIDKAKLSGFLEEQGDCALLTGNDKICRFHVHTNQPQKIFTKLLDDYLVQYPKVDDMQRQFEVNHHRQDTIALLTDSSADLPQSFLDKYQIHQVPLNIHIGEHQLLDRFSFESDDFYHQLSSFSSYPKTSYPKLMIKDKVNLLAEHYDQVLAMPIAKAMSGTYDAIAEVAKAHSNVRVVDSKNASGAHGLLLHYAAQLIKEGNPIETIINCIQKAVDTTFMYVAVDQFGSMIRSGRVPKIAGRIAEFAGIKPIVSINKEGMGYVYDKAFSFNGALKKVIKAIQDKIRQSGMVLQEYCIIHANAKEKALEFAKMTAESFGFMPTYIEPVSLAIGLHAGEGCVAIAARMSESG